MTGSQLEIWSALASSSLMVAECDLTHELRLRLEHTVDLEISRIQILFYQIFGASNIFFIFVVSLGSK